MKKLLILAFIAILAFFSMSGPQSAQAQNCATDPDSCYGSEEAIGLIYYQWTSGGLKDILADNVLYFDESMLYADENKSVQICDRIDQEIAGEFSGTETYTGVKSCKPYTVSVTLKDEFIRQINSAAKVKVKINVEGPCDANGKFTEEKTVGSTTTNLTLATTTLNQCALEIFDNEPANINYSVYIDNKELRPAIVGLFAFEPIASATQCSVDFTNLTQGGSTTCADPSDPRSRCTAFEGASIDDQVRIQAKDIDSLGYQVELYSNTDLIKTVASDQTFFSHETQFLTAGRYDIKVSVPTSGGETVLCHRVLNVTNRGEDLVPPGDNVTREEIEELELDMAATIPLCEAIDDAELRSKCESCQGSADVPAGVWTGIGCMPTNLAGLVSSLFTTFSGILGALIFFCVVSNGLKIMASRGNAETMKKAQEAITACVVGFIVMALSVLFLKIVGVDILKLPGWS